MNIRVEYKEQSGKISNQTHKLSLVAFIKHLSVAGMGYAPRPQKFLRAIGMFFRYAYYMQRQAFINDRFSEPPINLSDPTEKGQFSNLAGKAIADFLSKRIDQSIYTVNYEAAMRIHKPPIPLFVNGRQVRRPDLLAYTANSRFAIEAKGFSGGFGNMDNHKNQSQTGGIRVNFTVASVSYDLFNQVKCKYHDPFNDNVPYDNELLRRLTKDYYGGLSEFLDQKYCDYHECEYQSEHFYEVYITPLLFDGFFDEYPFRLFCPPFRCLSRCFERMGISLILPIKIQEYATNGITNEIKPFIFDPMQGEDSIYIDNDRIGLKLKNAT